MFFSKSYTPLTFNETYIHKTISTKLQMYQENKSLTNIIFYGNNGTGKYILSQLLLESIFGPTIYKKKIIMIDQIMYIVMFIMRSIYQKRMIDQN
jgi:DNA replication protein DnaC